MTHSHDFLPMTPHVSALVRRITMRLSGYLAFHDHKTVTLEEGLAMFDLSEASKILDQIATLPGMAQAEDRARRDLLDLYDIFDQTMPTASVLNTSERQSVDDAGDAQGCQP